MPGFRYSVHNPDGESYVPDADKFAADQAARSADFMTRAALMKQNAGALQAQLYDSAQNRTLQRDLTGTAKERFGYDQNLQRDRIGGESLLEGQRQTGSTDRTRLQMGPATQQADMEKSLFNENSSLRVAERDARLNELKMDAEFQRAFTASNAAKPATSTTATGPLTTLGGQGQEVASSPAAGSGGQDMLRNLAMYKAAMKGQPLPDFGARDEVQRDRNMARAAEARAAGDFTKAKQIEQETGVRLPAIDQSAGIETILGKKLPDFNNRDTASRGSRIVGGLAAGGATGLGVGAAFGGFGAVPGAIIGSALGGIAGAFGGDNNPTAAEQDDLVGMYLELVKAYAIKNGGNEDLAKQQARAKFEELLKSGNQKGDALTDWDADMTTGLMGRLR